jgi:hypothetical protein
MGSAPYALSVHHFISSVGADAGFASIIGLAVLVLLYFAQARETSSLREQADQAAQRVAQLESRLAHAAAVQSAPVTAAPLPPGVQPPPSSIGAVPNRPAPAIAAVVSPVPPAGVGAPPLSAATKLIPTPLPAAAAAARIASGQPSPAATGQASLAASGQAPVAAPGVGIPGPGVGVPGPGVGAPTNPSGPDSPSPVNRIVTPRPATTAGGATVTNGTGDHPVVPPPLPPRTSVPIRTGRSDRMLAELTGTAENSPSDITRVLTALAAVAVVAAIVIVLLSVTSGGTSPHTASSKSTLASNAPNAKPRTTAAKAAAVVPSSVTVTVLNGTAVYHLANSVASQLSSDGFNQGIAPANAATQTQTTTSVQYVPGDQRDAAAVAQALKLPTSSVQPITSTTQQLGCPQGTTCNVVVTLGANSANSASSQAQTTP